MDIITYALCKKADKEIIDMIHDMEGMTVQIVDEVPTVQEAQYNVMYLVDTNGDGKYEAYIKAKISDVDQIISLGSIIDLSDFYTKSEIDAALAGKQPLLAWDNVPTSGSSNAISSGAIYTALDKIKIEEMSDIEYEALVTKDPDKVYFVYEAEENSGTITPKPNGFKRIYKGDELYATNELPDITPHVELTQSQYDALVNPDEDTEYFITDSEAEGDFSNFETRMSRIEQEFIVYYQNGNQRIPLYTENIKKVIKIDNNTVDWYIDDPDTGKHYKATVTAEGQGNVRTNPQISVVEVV